MTTALWLACTLFTAGFLWRRTPEVWQDCAAGIAAVVLALWLRS